MQAAPLLCSWHGLAMMGQIVFTQQQACVVAGDVMSAKSNPFAARLMCGQCICSIGIYERHASAGTACGVLGLNCT